MYDVTIYHGDKHTDSVKNPHTKNEATVTLRNKNKCGGIGILK